MQKKKKKCFAQCNTPDGLLYIDLGGLGGQFRRWIYAVQLSCDVWQIKILVGLFGEIRNAVINRMLLSLINKNLIWQVVDPIWFKE